MITRGGLSLVRVTSGAATSRRTSPAAAPRHDPSSPALRRRPGESARWVLDVLAIFDALMKPRGDDPATTPSVTRRHLRLVRSDELPTAPAAGDAWLPRSR